MCVCMNTHVHTCTCTHTPLCDPNKGFMKQNLLLLCAYGLIVSVQFHFLKMLAVIYDIDFMTHGQVVIGSLINTGPEIFFKIFVKLFEPKSLTESLPERTSRASS